MSKLSSNILIQPQDLFVFSSTASADLGAKGATSDGREFVYVKAGGTALVPGTLQQAPAIIANLQNVAVSTQAIGDKTITLTISSTAITAGSLVGGVVVFNAGTGVGQTLKIASHNSGTITSLVLKLEDAILTATSSSDTKACVLPNPYNGVIINPTTPTNKPVGVAIAAITAGYYGWIQTKGLVSCLNDSATAVGLAIAPSQAVAGAVKTGATTLDSVGSAAQAGVNTEYRIVDIRL